MANGLQSALRRRRITAEKRDGILDALRRLDIELDDETAEHAWDATLALSDRFALTPYDAAYL